jgi:flagellar motor switch protein FliG
LFKHWLTMHTEDIHYLEILAKFLLLMSENRSLRVMGDMKEYKLDEITDKLVRTKNIP